MQTRLWVTLLQPHEDPHFANERPRGTVFSLVGEEKALLCFARNIIFLTNQMISLVFFPCGPLAGVAERETRKWRNGISVFHPGYVRRILGTSPGLQ